MLNGFFDKYIFTNNLKYTHNNFYLINVPFAIVPVEILASMLESADTEMHRKIYLGVKKGSGKELMKQFSVEQGLAREKTLRLFENFFTASGWGKIQNIDLDEEAGRAIFTVENSPFASAFKEKASRPVDTFLRGVLAGVLSEIFGKDVDCVESECIAVSGKRCKFVVKPREDFDLEKRIVRDQLDFSEEE